jgi:cardiolipin synthase
VVHAKTAVVDQSWITVGSYNLNQLSALGSIELNIDVFDKTMAHELHHRLKFLMQDQSEELSARQVKNLSFSHRLKNALAYRLINWGTALLVYFIKDEEE